MRCSPRRKSALSQRTRARTTSDAAPRPSEQKKNKKKSGTGSSAGKQEKSALSPHTLARTLRAVADELERDPELARRVSNSLASTQPGVTPETAVSQDETTTSTPSTPSAPAFQPRLIPGTSPELGPGIPDPFLLLSKRGEKGLRTVLEDLRLGTLRAIIREYHLDPQGKLIGQNDAGRLRKAIMEAVVR
jgi:hypothetical protein